MHITEDDIDAAIAAREALLRSARTPYDVTDRDAMRAALEAAFAKRAETR